MIKHIALFKLKNKVNEKSKEENKKQIIKNVQRLKNDIKEIKKIEIGDHFETEKTSFPGWDLVVYVEFDTVAEYETYFTHPTHKEVAAFAALVSESVAGITYDKSFV